MRYAKLRGLIREKYTRQSNFAEAMGMNPTTLSKKLCGGVDWTRQEIEKACELLGIPAEQLHAYFFTL
jgi:transcriptional regulator with XRE-family HTH domain